LIHKYITLFFSGFLYRELTHKTTAAENGKIIVYCIKNVIEKRFPDLFEYMFLLKETSRNSYNNDRRDAVFSKNYFKIFKMNLPHPDTIDQVLLIISPEKIEILKTHLVSKLFDQKLLRKFRFLGKYYFVAVDATGTHTFDHQHCEHCLRKTSKNGKTTWFHYVLEAKLVTSSGLAISLASEFIENVSGRDFEKQDCEQKAFVRLAEKIKKFFPRLPICILADGLYPNKTVFSICRKNDWKFIITLKDGNLKTFHQEVKLLKGIQREQEVFRADATTLKKLKYKYINNIEYDGYMYSWVACEETITFVADKTQEIQNFVYITNVEQTNEIVVRTADGGRLRWKIENEGFNTQKKKGYKLQHKFSRVSYIAMQNYYLLLQIAHMINQLVEKCSEMRILLKSHSKQTVKALWKDLHTFLKSIPFTRMQLLAFLSD